MLVIIWHLLSDPDLEYVDLGALGNMWNVT
jgi:hypothetical protein